MLGFHKVFLLVLLFSGIAFAQSREETMMYITQEIKALESDEFTITELKFSENGKNFIYKSYLKGHGERALSFTLDSVEFYPVTHKDSAGPKHYSLVVECRGKKEAILVNGSRFQRSTTILDQSANRVKVKGLAKAFNHLASLVAGRTTPFQG